MTDELREDGRSWKSADPGSPPVLGTLPSPSVAELCSLLASRHRRRLLTVLKRDPAPVRISDVAAEIAAAENDTTPGSVGEDRRREVHAGLLHNHLPKLRDAGMVTYDRDAGTVAPGEHATEAEPLLGVARRLEDPVCSNDD